MASSSSSSPPPSSSSSLSSSPPSGSTPSPSPSPSSTSDSPPPTASSTQPPSPPPQPTPPTNKPSHGDPSSPPPQPSLWLENDPKRTGFDPQTRWWINLFKITTHQITPEGAHHYREQRYRVHEERDCQRCREFRDWAFNYSPTVRFMNDKIAQLNGRLGPDNVVCRRCPARVTADGDVRRMTGGFEPAHGILLCANEFRDRGHLEDTLAHEMVHAYDHLRFRGDFRGEKDLRQAACTEIRASMLSGECRWTREAWTRGNWTLSQQFQKCVRRNAVQSVMARPWCKDDVQAVKVVNQVWDSCFADTRPFDEVYR